MEYDYLDRKTMKAVRVTYNCEHCGKKLHINEDCKCPQALEEQDAKRKWPSHTVGEGTEPRQERGEVERATITPET